MASLDLRGNDFSEEVREEMLSQMAQMPNFAALENHIIWYGWDEEEEEEQSYEY